MKSSNSVNAFARHCIMWVSATCIYRECWYTDLSALCCCVDSLNIQTVYCISVFALISNGVNEDCVFVHVVQETPVSPRERNVRSHHPNTMNDISHFLLFVLFFIVSLKWRQNETLISQLAFKAGTQIHMRAKEGRQAGWEILDRMCMIITVMYNVFQNY